MVVEIIGWECLAFGIFAHIFNNTDRNCSMNVWRFMSWRACNKRIRILGDLVHFENNNKELGSVFFFFFLFLVEWFCLCPKPKRRWFCKDHMFLFLLSKLILIWCTCGFSFSFLFSMHLIFFNFEILFPLENNFAFWSVRNSLLHDYKQILQSSCVQTALNHI